MNRMDRQWTVETALEKVKCGEYLVDGHAALFLVSKGINNKEIFAVFVNQVRYLGFHRHRVEYSGSSIHSDEEVQLWRRCKQALIELMETNHEALQYVTDLIKRHYMNMPVPELNEVKSTVLSIDPKKALPGSRKFIKVLLKGTPLHKTDRQDFQQLLRRLP